MGTLGECGIIYILCKGDIVAICLYGPTSKQWSFTGINKTCNLFRFLELSTDLITTKFNRLSIINKTKFPVCSKRIKIGFIQPFYMKLFYMDMALSLFQCKLFLSSINS